MVGPVVALAGEIEPLGVAELIAHEAEPALAAEGEGKQADDLVEGDAALDDRVLVLGGHVPIHLFVHEPEGEGLIADECLVVAFRVGDGGLAVAAVGEDAPEFVEVPVLVALVLEELDPMIRDAHGEAVGETNAALRVRAAQAGHAGHVLGDDDRAGLDFRNELVGEFQVKDGVLVRIGAEVIVVGAEGAIAVGVVEHRGDAIEAEAVEAIFLQPEANIREQELPYLRARVVKAFRVPLRMVAFSARVEVLVAGAIEVVEPLRHIFHSVGVNDVEYHGDAHAVSGIDKVFQILRRAETRAGGEKGRHVVTEGAVVGMLLHSHELDGVVAGLCDARQDFVGELTVGMHARFLACHAGVALVNERGGDHRGVEHVFPNVRFRRAPDLARIIMRNGILHGAGDGGGQPVAA